MKTDAQKLIIKTITCHDVYNFGASLQAYALMRYLIELGHEVEIINYKPPYLTFNLWAIGAKWKKNPLLRILYFLYVVPKKLSLRKRRKKFDKFTQNKLILTKKTYKSAAELQQSPPVADVFFAGSDQIWNHLVPNGKDSSFFLKFADSKSKKASYAASFSVEDIPNELENHYKEMLSNIDFISVRESTGLKLLKNLGISEAQVVVDPVFLLDHDDWGKLTYEYSKEKYIFVYDQENNKKIRDAAKNISKRYNLKIFAIESLYPMSYAHKRIKDADPIDFVSLISNAEVVLTNSFHCIAFSIIFNKKFWLFKRTHMAVNSRMVDLLKCLALSDRIVDDHIERLNNDEIDYSKVLSKLQPLISSSYNFIDSVLKDGK
ncbi:MAG: polysaccharide pyruvyl transferase family protein [Salinivirgaceae bacterium]|nr:polysaccharide pyruvyl transferase family protein [Salinivirgaceae bacterium]MDY0281413.1 polysaccharide pyruvyl transferase family protein [Salinivirgaceae bacterium]